MNNLKCIKCGNEMISSNQLQSLLNVTLDKDGVAHHDLKSFVPVKTHICKHCGYVELEHAFKDQIPLPN